MIHFYHICNTTKLFDILLIIMLCEYEYILTQSGKYCALSRNAIWAMHFICRFATMFVCGMFITNLLVHDYEFVDLVHCVGAMWNMEVLYESLY